MGNLKNMLIGKRLVIALGVLLTVVAAPVAIVLMNQYIDTEASVSDAMRQDGQSYAAQWRIGLDEAIRRLQLQRSIGALGAELEENEAGTYAGHWIRHGTDSSDFGMVVRFTSNGNETIQRYGQHVANGPLADMVELRSADVTLAELRQDQSEAMGAISGQDIPVESQIDVQEGRIKVYVTERGRLDDAIQKGNLSLPEKVDVVSVSTMGRLEADIYGGLSITRCTTGFGVENAVGTRGVTTAGHCDDDQVYDGEDLDFEDGEVRYRYDIQWHTAPDFTVTNKVQSNSNGGTRRITGTVNRSAQSVGEYVCKYGRATNYTCGYIDSTDYKPDPENIPSPSPSFIRVDNTADDDNLSSGGDSGGPWFLLNDAYGSHIGSPAGDSDDAFYMAVNYISRGIHVDVLTSP